MAGIDGIVFEDMENPVIKYNQVYKPNPSACPGEEYSSFLAMMDACRARLEKAAAEADEAGIPFVPYKCEFVLKPEYQDQETYPEIC